ncbi:MAG: hypothetical protein NC489_29380 [Ruminococcus flavefaciens]|nr:hypothetical protein [Ruminococcus flavefaciens]
MIINITIENTWTIKELINLTGIEALYVSKETIWCEGFYVKLLSSLLEINVYDSNISEKHILCDLMQPILNKSERTFVRIQKERRITQFIANKI